MMAAEAGSLRNRAESELVQRIVASPGFARSPRLCRFLLFISERFFEARVEEISEQNIGIQVFDRPADYLPAEDSIVRSHARVLRSKLEAYFATDGANEQLLLKIPKGGYVPVFELRPSALEAPAHDAPREEVPRSDVPSLPISRYILICAVIGILSAGLGFFTARREARQPIAPVAKPHPLWSRLISPTERALFVPADSGLVVFQNLTRKNLDLREYSTRDFVGDTVAGPLDTASAIAKDVGSRRYTTMVDLNLAARLLQAPWAVPGRLQIRYPRDVKIDDLKGVNVILSGLAEANPWVQLFQSKLNFRFSIDETTRTWRVSNSHPAPGESAVYFNSPSDPMRRAYALIAFQPGLTGSASVLLLQGTTVAGTEAAADFVLDDDRLLPALKRIAPPRDKLPYFEILVATTNLGGQAPRSELVSIKRSQ